MTPGLLAVFLGVLLVDAAVRGVHPWCPILEAFGAECPPAPGAAALAVATGGATSTTHSGVGELTAAAAAFHAEVTQRFPQARYLGGFSCRTIRPHDGGSSSTWSEHAWSNAVDYTGTPKIMARIGAFAQLNRNRFDVNNVIPPGSAINAVHIDFLPSHAGQTPPCAGGGK